jgi:hypothetical protein
MDRGFIFALKIRKYTMICINVEQTAWEKKYRKVGSKNTAECLLYTNPTRATEVYC